MSHLPGCRLITFREIHERADMQPPPPPGDDWFDRGGIEKCVEGCPVRERRKERALEVAREKGWLREDGTWVW